MFSELLVASCLPLLLFFSPLPSACQVLNSSTVAKRFHSVCHLSQPTQPCPTIARLFRFYTSWRQLVWFTKCLQSSCSGMWDPRSVEYQSCKCAVVFLYWSRDWLHSNILKFLGCRHLLDTEISVLYSFLHRPKKTASVCFARGPALNRSVKEFAAEL